MPLKQIFEIVVQENEIKNSQTKESFFKDKISTLAIILINIIIFIITQIIIDKISNVEINNILSEYSNKIAPEEINKKINHVVININNSVLTNFGALSKELIQQGQLWRLLTCAFLHSNLIHIACNMYSFYIIGPQIQQIYGSVKIFIYIYYFMYNIKFIKLFDGHIWHISRCIRWNIWTYGSIISFCYYRKSIEYIKNICQV